MFYIFGSWFTSNFVIDFVITVLLIALDFWVVKNVSGRLLAGLRWWNDTDETGETHWHFESLDQAVRYPKHFRNSQIPDSHSCF